eukprot:PhF_6_TR34933/c0_g1_i3/m.50635
MFDAMKEAHDVEYKNQRPSLRGQYRIVALDDGFAVQWCREYAFSKQGGETFQEDLFVRQMAKRFHLDKTPRQVQPIIVMNTSASEVCVLDDEDSCGDVVASLYRVLEIVYFRHVCQSRASAWIAADSLCVKNNEGQNEAVVILGRHNIGKTTLSHHVMNMFPQTKIISTNGVVMQPGIHNRVEVVGAPFLNRVKIGAILGTLLPNPHLEGMITPPEAVEYLANTESQLWDIEKCRFAPISKCYGADRTENHGVVKAIVHLNWSPMSGGPAMVRDAPPASIAEALQSNLRSHLLIPHNSSGLEEVIHNMSREGVGLYEVGGNSKFDTGAKFISSILKC